MSIWSILVLALYGVGLVGITLYTVAQVHLVYHYLKSKSGNSHTTQSLKSHPVVTIQLPIFNELYVVNRLIDAVAQFDWPKDKFEIQVLDDSTDETVEIIAQKVEEWQQKGIDIKHVQRDSREGYKAGALEYGQKRAKGEFIAIFDADFVPEPDFLVRTLPVFTDEEIGMVQTRWGHLNEDYSLLTKALAFALNGHFTVEQMGRNQADFFMNFNGTAGVWRKSCIVDAGGWEHDTITEDLDLSYRAQMKGWEFKYLEDVVSPAEIPVAISAIKTQQYRWTKGSAESARKHLGNVWNTENSLIKKLQATSHLLNSSVFIFILLISIFSVPALYIKAQQPELSLLFQVASVFLIGFVGWILFYGTSFIEQRGSTADKIKRMLFMFPVFLSISMAFAVHNSVAVIKGYMGKTSPFIRTPKFNITQLSDRWENNKYLINKMDATSIIEGLLVLYFLGGIALAFILGDWGLLPFHVMLFAGYSIIFGYSLYENMLKPA